MADSPIPIARHSQTELIDQSPDLQNTTAIDEDSISDKPDSQILFQSSDKLTSSSTSHIDENNENDAVGYENDRISGKMSGVCFRLKFLSRHLLWIRLNIEQRKIIIEMKIFFSNSSLFD